MEDSPLSITANITGILNFIAAILAFVYVRYNTLENSMRELDNIQESVNVTLEETKSMLATQSLAGRTDQGSDIEWLHNIIRDLYHTEMTIMRHILIVRGSKRFSNSTRTPRNQDTEVSKRQPKIIKEVQS